MAEKNKNICSKLKNRKTEGSSLVIVVCVSAFLLAFALALVYTAGLLLSGANRRLERERCYQLAKSFAGVLDGELKKFDQLPAPGSNTFYEYAYKFLEGQYGDYDPDHPEATVFHYTAADPGGLEEGYGKIKVALYKEGAEEGTPEADVEMEGEITPSQADTIRANKLLRYYFTVEVTASQGDVTYRYATKYQQKAMYEVDFSHNGTRIVWDAGDSQWHSLSIDGPVYTIPSGDTIYYAYRAGEMRGCTFENAYQE